MDCPRQVLPHKYLWLHIVTVAGRYDEPSARYSGGGHLEGHSNLVLSEMQKHHSYRLCCFSINHVTVQTVFIYTWYFIVFWVFMCGLCVYIYLTWVYGHSRWWESNYVNECLRREGSGSAASICHSVFVSYSSDSFSRDMNQQSQRGRREEGRMERKWLTCTFLCLHTHSEEYFTACGGLSRSFNQTKATQQTSL